MHCIHFDTKNLQSSLFCSIAKWNKNTHAQSLDYMIYMNDRFHKLHILTKFVFLIEMVDFTTSKQAYLGFNFFCIFSSILKDPSL
jgi:hypothetical protein